MKAVNMDAKRLNVAVEILEAYCEVFDNKEYDLLSENEKSLLYNATVLLEKVVVRMQNHGDYSLYLNDAGKDKFLELTGNK